MREKRAVAMRFKVTFFGLLLAPALLWTVANAQYYPDAYYQDPRYGQYDQVTGPMANLQYDQRSAEQILQEQVANSMQAQRAQPAQPPQPYAQSGMYQDSHYGHRISDETQVQRVMAEARHIAGLLSESNGKPFIIIDKRNFQFYLYSKDGRLLRIGPVAIGKGATRIGQFETPVGIFPIKRKEPVADWIRPDWYFIEEGEPIPKRWEDRRVPGFFRYKVVYDGTRYIHYAEATGGRLTHGCLGLDWEDAEAVFHTLEVGSYCIIIDRPFIRRLAAGEFPVKTPPQPEKKQLAASDGDEENASTKRGPTAVRVSPASALDIQSDGTVFGNMW